MSVLARGALGVAAALFLVVGVLLVYAFSAARRHADGAAVAIAAGAVRRELAWTALSAMLLLVLFVYAV